MACFRKPADELDYSQIINIKEDITVACFVDSPQHILFGTTNGKIKVSSSIFPEVL